MVLKIDKNPIAFSLPDRVESKCCILRGAAEAINKNVPTRVPACLTVCAVVCVPMCVSLLCVCVLPTLCGFVLTFILSLCLLRRFFSNCRNCCRLLLLLLQPQALLKCVYTHIHSCVCVYCLHFNRIINACLPASN